MKTERAQLEDVVELSRRLMRQYYQGEYDEWFSRLAPQAVWIGTGEPMLVGADAIRQHFLKKDYMKDGEMVVFQEEYSLVPLGKGAAEVLGELVVGPDNRKFLTVVLLSLTYRLLGGETKLVAHHLSYDFIQSDEHPREPLRMDLGTRQFIRSLLLERAELPSRVPVKAARQTVYLDPDTILYIRRVDRHTEFVCVDQVVSCATALCDLAEEIQRYFCAVRRGYLVNPHYIVALRRYEVELVNHMTIRVPAAGYMQLKEELRQRMGRDVSERRKRTPQPKDAPHD